MLLTRRKGIAMNIDKMLVNYDFMCMFPQFITIVLPTAISNHTPILISFSTKNKVRKGVPFRYVNNWCYLQGYNHCFLNGYIAEIWRIASYKFIHKFQAIKFKLKAWNQLRAKENTTTELQEEFNEAFRQSDQNPKNDALYEVMYCKSLELTT